MWYNDTTLFRNFAIALTNAEALEDPDDFIAFFQKPQRYNEEFDVWKENSYPTDDSDSNWEEFVDGISSDETE